MPLVLASWPVSARNDWSKPIVRVTTADGMLNITCSDTLPYTVSLDAGSGTGATTAVRKICNVGNTLNYGLFHNAAFSQDFGNSDGANTVAGTGKGRRRL